MTVPYVSPDVAGLHFVETFDGDAAGSIQQGGENPWRMDGLMVWMVYYVVKNGGLMMVEWGKPR